MWHEARQVPSWLICDVWAKRCLWVDEAMNAISRLVPWVLAVLLGVALFYQTAKRNRLAAELARIESTQHSRRQSIETTPNAPLRTGTDEPAHGRNGGPIAAKTAQRETMPGRVRNLREFLSRVPDQGIPEFQLTTEGDWYTAVAGDGNLESEAEFREALARLRALAERRFAVKAQPALKSYMSAQNGAFPEETAALGPYFEGGMAADILSRYKVVPSSEVPNVRMGGDWIITQSSLIDSDYDSRVVIGPNGLGTSGPRKRKK